MYSAAGPQLARKSENRKKEQKKHCELLKIRETAVIGAWRNYWARPCFQPAAIVPLWNVSTDLPLLTILMSSFIGLVTYWLSSFQPSDVHPTLLIIFFRIFVKMSLDQTFLFSAATMYSFFFSDTFCTHKSWVFQFLSKSKLATILIDVTGSRQRYMQLRFRTPSVRNFFHKRQFSLPWQKIYKFPFN